MDFVANVLGSHGDSGRQWLAALPSLIRELASEWTLQVGAPFELTYNFVAACLRADGSPAVLKLGVPGPERTAEIEGLRLFAGEGCIRLLESDTDRGAALLERAEPGIRLSAAGEAEAVDVAASLMRRLRRPAPESDVFPTASDWGEAFARLRARSGGGAGPLPPDLLETAEAIFARPPVLPMLLHGDLHHANILSAQRTPWLAIDPMPVLAEPALEVAVYLRNHRPLSVLKRRVAAFAEALELEEEDIRDWALAGAVLSACWTIEDGGDDWQEPIAIAKALQDG